jgi:hypothetical protein
MQCSWPSSSSGSQRVVLSTGELNVSGGATAMHIQRQDTRRGAQQAGRSARAFELVLDEVAAACARRGGRALGRQTHMHEWESPGTACVQRVHIPLVSRPNAARLIVPAFIWS